jgi:hypothetical protein
MSDVRKALEAAADAIYRDMFPERDGLAMETDAELRAHYYRAGRAAFLAGLKAMPRDTMMFMGALAAAIEKETQA